VNIPRKHHYIPVFYLKQWAGSDRRVCEFKRVHNKIVTRRTFPDGTGYKVDLYRLDGLPDPIAQVFESTFMRMVDTEANYALQRIVHGDQTPWDAKMRSAWTRFILSLRFRNPESVDVIKRQMIGVWHATVQGLRENYAKLRHSSDPPVFEDFMARTDPELPQKAAFHLLQEIIDNPRVGPAIFDMHWSRVALGTSSISLLTSDRPLDMPGLGSKDSYIALPIGPKMLFVAGHDDMWVRRLADADPTMVIKNVNQTVVQQARQFVWGIDNGQLRFVQNRMSKTPDRPIITDEQKQRAIDAARGDSSTSRLSAQ
jgi:Protein of unknown function (DUF4238)